jgi:hypothetical protein
VRRAPLASSKADKCATKWCRNRRAHKVTRWRSPISGEVIVYKSKLPYCWKCQSKRLRERHPETYVLNAMRQRARKRGIPFTITLKEFRGFCQRTGYLDLRGRTPGSMTVDRIDHDKGYHIWNIRPLSHGENSANGHVVPGQDCKQNQAKPETYDYDFGGPEPDYVPPVTPSEPF